MAKKKKPPAAPAAKSLAANRRRRRARTTITKTTREVRETRANPPALQDLTQVLLPGFAAYAGTRILQRIVFTFVQKRWPKLGKHAHALAGAAAFGGVWFFAHRVKAIAKYHDGIVMGSGVAAAQGIATCYLPQKYSWLLADCSADDVVPIDATVTPLPSQPAATAGDEYSYLESELDQIERTGSKRTRTVRGPNPSRTPVANAMRAAATGQDTSNVVLDPDLLQELGDDEAIDSLYSGAFSTN